VPRFQGQIFVIAIDGSIVADENFGNLLVDIAVLRSLGIKVVLVHGIGHQLQELSALRGVAISNSDGTGVTDAATLDLAIRASSRVSHVILEGLTGSSLKAVITNAVRAVPVGIIKGVDQQLTGKVERIDKELLGGADRAPGGAPHLPARLRARRQVAAGQFRPPRRGDGRGPPRDEDHLPGAQPGLEIEGEVRHEISVDALRSLLSDHPDRIAESSRSKAAHAIKAIETGVTPRCTSSTAASSTGS
jgi:amino-acid N-acetyltransferase